jgi:hypothetical protein
MPPKRKTVPSDAIAQPAPTRATRSSTRANSTPAPAPAPLVAPAAPAAKPARKVSARRVAPKDKAAPKRGRGAKATTDIVESTPAEEEEEEEDEKPNDEGPAKKKLKADEDVVIDTNDDKDDAKVDGDPPAKRVSPLTRHNLFRLISRTASTESQRSESCAKGQGCTEG